ncbi:hypothetical protein RB195_017867 [Necator americanus]|uniref:EGF-like domain-containing protein n=1 Tax=Necator americanus TaxID=51031 RepID=A0ABR1C749_NECAM
MCTDAVMTILVYFIQFLFAATLAQERLKDLPLPPDYCKNGGVFVNGECVCTLRYEGKQCEQERCLNGGRRHKVNGQVRCHCPFGLSGDRCEKVTYCEPGKGKLVNGKCECSARWTGLFCQMRTCYNGIPTGGMEGFCLCDVGFTGPFCDVPLICENGGKVTQDNECSCPSEYTGERCELCAIGHILEGKRCVPEVLESSLVAHAGSLSSRSFAWPIVVIGCVAALAVVLLITAITLAVCSFERILAGAVSEANINHFKPTRYVVHGLLYPAIDAFR